MQEFPQLKSNTRHLLSVYVSLTAQHADPVVRELAGRCRAGHHHQEPGLQVAGRDLGGSSFLGACGPRPGVPHYVVVAQEHSQSPWRVPHQGLVAMLLCGCRQEGESDGLDGGFPIPYLLQVRSTMSRQHPTLFHGSRRPTL